MHTGLNPGYDHTKSKRAVLSSLLVPTTSHTFHILIKTETEKGLVPITIYTFGSNSRPLRAGLLPNYFVNRC